MSIVDKFKGKALLAPCCASPGLGWQWEILTAWCPYLGLRSKTAAPGGHHAGMGFAGAWGSTSGLLSLWGAGRLPQERHSCIFLSFFQ